MERAQAIKTLVQKLTDHLVQNRGFGPDDRPGVEQLVTEYYSDPQGNGAIDVQNLIGGQDLANISSQMAESGFIDWNQKRTKIKPESKGATFAEKMKALAVTQTGKFTETGIRERQAGLEFLRGQ
jgi:hypothetical protein